MAAQWKTAAQGAADARVTMQQVATDIGGGELRLQGDFAPKVAEAAKDLPGALDRLAIGYGACAAALDKYAGALEQQQDAWRRHEFEFQVAEQDRRAIELELDRLRPGWQSMGDRFARGWQSLQETVGVGVGDGMQAEVEAAFARREAAQERARLADRLARDARELRDKAEGTCAREINEALDRADIRNKRWYEKAWNWVKETFTNWDKFVKFCETLSMVIGVIAIFATGPFGLVLAGIALALTAVVIADKVKKILDGKLGWKDLAGELAMVALNKFGGKLIGKGLKALQNTKFVTAASRAAHNRIDKVAKNRDWGDTKRNLAHRATCKVTGHPVDIATGKVFTSFTDLELPGPLLFVLDRVWFSTSTYRGPFGHGWHHTYDAALFVGTEYVVYRTPDGRFIELFPLDVGESTYERQERLTISRNDAGYLIRGADGVTRRFTPTETPSTNVDAPTDDETRPTAEATYADPDELTTYRLSDVIARGDHRISLEYDEAGRLAEVVDSGGRAIRFEHDTQDRVLAVTAPHPDEVGARFAVATYAYDALGNLATMTDARGHVFTYEYAQHLLVRETDRTGLTFTFEYDGTDETARCIYTAGDDRLYERRLTYNPNVTTVTDSLGHISRHEHEHGLVIRTIDALGGITSTEYDYHQPVTERDPLDRESTYEYDYRGNLITVTTPDGSSVQTRYDDHDQPVSAADQVGGEWAWEYDPEGLLTLRRDPLGRETALGYGRGLLESIVDPAGGRTWLRYDDQGMLAAVTTPDGAVSSWQRNALGWPVAATDPLGNVVRRTFDLGGNITRVEEPDGNVRTLDYDGESNLTSAVDALYDVGLAYQGMGRLASRTQAGTTVQFEYDTEEQLTGIVNEHGYVYSFTYGPTGLVSTERGFDGIMRVYERDVAGRVASVRRASGMITRHDYDELDRVVRVAHSDGSSQRYAYRTDGALMLAGNDTIDVTFERDVLGRLLRETQGARWVASAYDALDRRIRMTSSMGADQTITRNAMGDVMEVSGNGFSATFTRDALGQELTRSLPGGVEARWHRDRIGRPVRQEVVGATGVVRERTYDWDVSGRLRGILDSLAGPVRYEHDGLGQLVSAMYGDGTVELRMPDAVGNLFRTEDRSDREYGAAGQVLSLIDESGRRVRYDYDPEGNLIAKSADDGETWRYRWATVGNMSAVERPDGTEVTFGYDALSRRVWKAYRDQTTHWVWDGDVILHEWVDEAWRFLRSSPTGLISGGNHALPDELRPAEQGGGSMPLTWLFDPESFAPAGKIHPSNSVLTFVTDHLGNPHTMLTPEGGGTWSAIQSASGSMRYTVGEPNENPFRFAGQYEDAETGLYYNRFRYYDPESANYLSQDPIRARGNLALYAYPRDSSTQSDVLGLKLTTAEIGEIAELATELHFADDNTRVLSPLQNTSGHGPDWLFKTDRKALMHVESKGNTSRLNKWQRMGGASYLERQIERSLQWARPLPGAMETRAEVIQHLQSGAPVEHWLARYDVKEIALGGKEGFVVVERRSLAHWGPQPCGSAANIQSP